MKVIKPERAIEILKNQKPEAFHFENPTGADKAKIAEFLRSNTQEIIIIRAKSWKV